MLHLQQKILTTNLQSLLSMLFFEQVPHIFNGDWSIYRTWREKLACAIDVDPSEIIIIGSAAAGVSLSPSKNFKPFDEKSDVDVAIVSEKSFSEAWHHLRTVDITLDSLTPPQRAAVLEHQRRYVYWGCIATDRLLPIMPFAAAWLAARSQLAGMDPTAEREINFRIYKDFRALRGYQLIGLKNLQKALLTPDEEYYAEVS